MTDKQLYNVDDVEYWLNCGQTKAYRVIKDLNSELSAKGSIVQAGKIPAFYFHQRYKGFRESETVT